MAEDLNDLGDIDNDSEDIYDTDEVEQEVISDQIAPEEAGFMQGYDRTAEQDFEEGYDRVKDDIEI